MNGDSLREVVRALIANIAGVGPVPRDVYETAAVTVAVVRWQLMADSDKAADWRRAVDGGESARVALRDDLVSTLAVALSESEPVGSIEHAGRLIEDLLAGDGLHD